MKKLAFFLIFCALGLSSCFRNITPQADLASSNPDAKVQLLFEVDGCKVYRFFDRGNFRYFTNCKGGNSSVGWIESCGKNCTYYAENMTTYPDSNVVVKK